MPGPPLHVVGVYPTPGQGTECGVTAPDDCGVPRNVALELRFDRYLLPSTAIRQSVLLYTGFEDIFVFLEPDYDVLERVVRYRLPPGALLQPGLLYSVKITPPDPKDAASNGFRAYDGALLEPGRVRLEYSFRTARRDPEPVASSNDASPTCADVLSILQQSGCASATCHDAEEPAAGLRLDSPKSFSETAVRVVAHETDIGPEATHALVDSPRFGVGMPIVDPGNPANSYLLYKLLLNPQNFGNAECATRYQVSLPRGACLPPSDAEGERLHEDFVLLDPMPPPPAALPSLDAFRAVERFIARDGECEL